MNFSRILLLISSVFCFFTGNDAAKGDKQEQIFTMRGRATFNRDFLAEIESGSKLTVELRDVSLADAPSKTISTETVTATRFPVSFILKYSASQIKKGATYSVGVVIKNKKNELLYTNDVNVQIVPLGNKRTKFVTVPVISVKQSKPTTSSRKTWPELVGTLGKDAVQKIKQETGFKDVFTIPQGSPVTYDYRTDRVRIFVDGKGKVVDAPMIG